MENFGLSASAPAQVEIRQEGKILSQGEVSILAHYEKVDLTLKPLSTLTTDTIPCEVVIRIGDKEVETVEFE